VHYVQYQYFLFFILLIWGVRTHPTHLRACSHSSTPGPDSAAGGKPAAQLNSVCH